MREDAGSDDGDDDSDTERSDGSTDGGYWDETMLGETAGAAADDEADDDEEPSGNVAGEFRPPSSIEPGTVNLENALFVIAGAYVAILGIIKLFVPVLALDAQAFLVFTAGVALVGIVFLGLFGVSTPDT